MLTDDLDGSEATETVAFALDGVTYEIDLTAEQADQLRESVSPYVTSARKLNNRRTPVAQRAMFKRSSNKPDTQQVRDWAKAQGIKVSERGRLSNDLLMKFQEAGR